MSQEEQKQKKKKKKKQKTVLITEQKVESKLLPDLVDALDELEREKKYVDIQICPKCKSPLVRRVGSMTGDMMAHLCFTPPKYECKECGWRERTVLKASKDLKRKCIAIDKSKKCVDIMKGRMHS